MGSLFNVFRILHTVRNDFFFFNGDSEWKFWVFSKTSEADATDSTAFFSSLLNRVLLLASIYGGYQLYLRGRHPGGQGFFVQRERNLSACSFLAVTGQEFEDIGEIGEANKMDASNV